MKRGIFILMAGIIGMPAFAQDTTSTVRQSFFKDYWESLIHGDVDRTHEKDLDISFAIIPSYSREGGFGIGGTATGLYRMDKNDSTMAPSNMAVSANAALNGFYTVAGNGINYFPDKRTKLVYSARFTRKTLDFWGISFDDCYHNPTSQYIRTQMKADADYSYRIGRYIHFGAVLTLNWTKASDIIDISYLKGQDKSYFMTGIGGSFQIDTRDNVTDPNKGFYLLLKEVCWPSVLGTAGMTNWATNVILCGYIPIWKGGILAGDLYGQFNKDSVPWILREETGAVNGRMRGYYCGRFTDACQISAQMELRQHLISRFGCVVWAGAGTVFPSIRRFRCDRILPNYGIGLRVGFKHNMNLRIDFGLGKETAGFTFGFCEAF